MGVKHVLQLGGIDVVAAGDDHALDALLEVDEAVVVHGAQVSGVDPGETVGVNLQGLGRLLGVVHVAQHHRGAAEADLAVLTVGHLLLGAGADDLVVGVREGQTDGALLGHVAWSQAGGGDALGGAVALPDLDHGVMVVEEFVKTLLQLHAEAVAAGVDALEAAEVRVLHLGQTQQGLVEGGDTGDEVAAVLEEKLGVALSSEPGHQDAAAAAGQHGVDGYAQAKAVEHGHYRQHPVAGPEEGVGGNDLGGQSVEVHVA